MKLTIFDKNNSGTTSARTGVRSAYINRKTGNISFSNTLKKGKESQLNRPSILPKMKTARREIGIYASTPEKTG